MAYQPFSDDRLLEPPVQRAAYSDRMALLMAEMSLLAYTSFDVPEPDPTGDGDTGDEDPGDEKISPLAVLLDRGGFTLVATYDSAATAWGVR